MTVSIVVNTFDIDFTTSYMLFIDLANLLRFSINFKILCENFEIFSQKFQNRFA